MTIIPNTSELRTLHIHSRQCSMCISSHSRYSAQSFAAIQAVTVGGHPAEFTIHDPLSNITMGGVGEAPDCHKHAELKRKLYSAMQECDEGELSIALPKELPVRTSGASSSNGMVYEGTHYPKQYTRMPLNPPTATPEPQTPGLTSQPGLEFAPIVVNIAYSLRNPVDGFEFVVPSDAYPYVSFSTIPISYGDSYSSAGTSCLHHALLP